MNNNDYELGIILDDCPSVENTIKQTTPDFNPGSGWWRVPKGNAWIGKRTDLGGRTRLEIWPEWGGYLEVDITHLAADASPFHG